MKLLKQTAFCLFLAIAASACTGTGEDGSSTPIDSTNVKGTQPATYGENDPAANDYPVYEGNMDTSAAALTTRGDSARK